MTKTFRLAHAWIDLKGLWGSGGNDQFRAALEGSWVAGQEVFRYGRTWLISRHIAMEQGLWSGHIGSVESDALSTLAWNEETKQFDRGEASGGVLVPFVERSDNFVVQSEFNEETDDQPDC